MKPFFDKIKAPLVVLDLANNHNGDIAHAKEIIETAVSILKPSGLSFAIKFQYRDLDSFIHEGFKGNHQFPYIKRFESTRLSWDEFSELIEFTRSLGALTACTPFDENSVGWIEEHGIDILKIASASFTDWPLLEKVVSTSKPIIASTAGASIEEVDRVASFFEHRSKVFALMHCVAAYPTPDEDLQLNRIDVLRDRYKGIPIGYSTHEDPKNTGAVLMAIAKGATILERHIGISTPDARLNGYSSSPDELQSWVSGILAGLLSCGQSGSFFPKNESEEAALQGLRRGVYAKHEIGENEIVKDSDVFFAIPLLENQLSANEWSKYLQVRTRKQISGRGPLVKSELLLDDLHEKVDLIVKRSRELFAESRVVLPSKSHLEISHHYGLDRFDEFGLVMITVVNREYCKKILAVFPDQSHPEQWHESKEETFNCLYGELELRLDGEWVTLKPGDSAVVQPGVRHFFTSKSGCVFEEISSTHQAMDSFYTDDSIMANRDRKTFVGFWS